MPAGRPSKYKPEFRQRYGDRFCGLNSSWLPIVWGKTNIPAVGSKGEE